MRRNETNATFIRCAIYTRKSCEDGLEQDFNSLDAQRLAGENYVASQVHEVLVINDGFSYYGETYKSLSAIATKITGTKWNGLKFFGVQS